MVCPMKSSLPLFTVLLSIISCACSTARVSPITTQFQGIKPRELFSIACSIGSALQSSSGEASLKVKSKEISGQFNAQIKATHLRSLVLQIEHPLKGPIAQVSIQKENYEIQTFDQDPPYTERGVGSWNGIPLGLIHMLFLGRVPCPEDSALTELILSPEGDLRVREKNQDQWTYQFRVWNGKPWPERIIWERAGRARGRFEMILDDPDPQSLSALSPLKWEVQSNEGLIKVRWKERASD